MTAHRALTLVGMGLLVGQTVLAASSVVQPVPITTSDRCTRCARLLEERYVAAEAIGEDGVVAKFRTIRCMLAYLDETGMPVKDVYTTDNRTGELVNVEEAVFVPVPIDSHVGIPDYGIGVTDYVAFKSTKEGERLAAHHGVTTMSWSAVRYYAHFLNEQTDSE